MLKRPNETSWSVKQICKMIQKEIITFENPLQRPADQWKLEDKSLLIDSLLRMYVPDIFAIQFSTENEEGRKISTYDIIDGKQRLTTISSYINDEWELTELEPIQLESTNEFHNISCKKFSQLPEEVQEEIQGHTLDLKFWELEDDEDEENLIKEIFYRLNNGKGMSREHLALVSAGKNVQLFVHRMLTEHKLFTEIAHFAESSVKKSDREMTVMQSILLVSGLDYPSFVAKDVEKIFSENEIADAILAQTEQEFNAIALTFKNHDRFVSKLSISAMVYMFSKSSNKTNSSVKLLEYVNYLNSLKPNERKADKYRKHTGAGSTKKDSVVKRINAMVEICNQ